MRKGVEKLVQFKATCGNRLWWGWVNSNKAEVGKTVERCKDGTWWKIIEVFDGLYQTRRMIVSQLAK